MASLCRLRARSQHSGCFHDQCILAWVLSWILHHFLERGIFPVYVSTGMCYTFVPYILKTFHFFNWFSLRIFKLYVGHRMSMLSVNCFVRNPVDWKLIGLFVFYVLMSQVRRYVRPFFQSSTAMAFFYDALTFTATRIGIAYMVVPFILLEFWSSVHVLRYLPMSRIGTVLYISKCLCFVRWYAGRRDLARGDIPKKRRKILITAI
jgi:hypothetical protein